MKTLLTTLFTLLLTFPSLAWGPTGHRVVGEIAEQHLSSKAQKAIMEVLGNESLASVSIFMDEIKSDTSYLHLNPWHYVSIPDGSNYHDCEKNTQGDVIKAITEITAKLKSGKLTAEEEAFHIKMLVHLVGDIHQPLHVGRKDDRGGNDVKCTWHGKATNLHRVWDTDMLEEYNMSYSELAQNLMRVMTDAQKTAWRKATVEEWAAESMTYREGLYDIGDGDLGYRYQYIHFPTIELRLSQAGIRLAHLLNEIYG